MTYTSYSQAHAALMELDRARTRVHRLLEDRYYGPVKIARMRPHEYSRAMARIDRHPDMREANDAYFALSAEIAKRWPREEARANRALARSMFGGVI